MITWFKSLPVWKRRQMAGFAFVVMIIAVMAVVLVRIAKRL